MLNAGREGFKRLALTLILALLPIAFVAEVPASANSTLLTTLSSPCTHPTRLIVRSNVTYNFQFYAGTADTIGEVYLQRQNGTQAYDNQIWIDIKQTDGTVIGRLNADSNLTYNDSTHTFTGLSGSVTLPSAGTYSATLGANAGAANHYFCSAQDNNTYGAAVTLTSSGSAVGWVPVEQTPNNPSNYYHVYPLIRFVSGLDTEPPALSSIQPASGLSSVTRSPTVSLNFSEPISFGVGEIRLLDVSSSTVVQVWNSSSATISGNTVLLGSTQTLDYSSSYRIEIDQGLFEDGSGNVFAGLMGGSAPTFTTLVRDLEPPIIASTSPSAGQLSVTTSPVFSITFSEDVQLGSGEIRLLQSSDSAVVASTSSVSVTGTKVVWDPSVSLSYESGYYLEITAGFLVDISDDANPFAGLTGPNAFSFSTIALPDVVAPTLTLSAAVSQVSTNAASFLVSANEPLECSTISTVQGEDFDFFGFSTISQVVQTTNACRIDVQTNVGAGQSLTISMSPAAGFSMSDIAGNSQTSIAGSGTITITIPQPTPAPAPAPLPTVTPSYSDWRISVGATNQVNPGEVFELQISITCNQEMSLTASPYYPSMYYMVRTSPWLNGYLSDRPLLSSDRKTATWTVQLEAPSSAGSFEMYAYARGQVCFGDSFNFAYSSRATLRIETGITGATTSPSVSQTASPAVTAGYTDWTLASTPSQVVERGSQLRLSVSITCNVSMRLDGAPYYPSMYYFLNSSPRVNGVFGRPVLSSDGKTATWEVSVAAPMTPGRYVFQAYGRDNPAGPTCFGSSQRFTYSGGKIVEVGDIQESTQSATSSPVAGYSSWRLSATGSQGMVEGSEISLNVSLTCNVRMSTNSAPYYPSMYYIVSSPDRINGVFSRPTISADGLTARWTVKVPAPESGTYNFSAYGRDNPSGGTCFGDSFNFAYSGNLPLVIGQEVVEEVTVSPEATPSPTAEPTVSPAPSAEPSPSPSATAAASPSPAQSPTPSATAAEPQTSATPVAPLRIVTPALPGSIQFGNNVFEISPAFVVSIIDSLRDSQELVGDEIVRVRLGESDWIETSIEEIELGTDPLVFQGQASEDTKLELEVISADGAQVLGVASYELNTSDEQVAVTMTESDSEQIPWQLIVLLTFAIFGIVIAAMSIRRRLNKK